MKNILILLLISISSYAQTVHRVTNGMNLQTVIDNAVSGDVVLVEGGVFGDIIVNKNLKLFGTGYYLNGPISNSGLQATQAVSSISNVTFEVTSSNSQIQGFKAGNISILSNQISVSKCSFNDLIISNSNIIIKQSYFNKFNIEPNLKAILLKNNIVNGNGSIGSGSESTLVNNSFVNGRFFTDTDGNIGNFTSIDG